MNSGGTRKSISSAYANISGTQKQIFPLLQESIYVWNKYNVVSSSSSTGSPYVSVYSSNSNVYNGEGANIFYADGYQIELYNGSYMFYFNDFSHAGTTPDMAILPDGYWIYSSSEYQSRIYSGGTWDYTNSCVTGATIYTISTRTTTTYSKGSTLYGQVTSTNRYAYPDNSYSGSYWYVYQGVQ